MATADPTVHPSIWASCLTGDQKSVLAVIEATKEEFHLSHEDIGKITQLTENEVSQVIDSLYPRGVVKLSEVAANKRDFKKWKVNIEAVEALNLAELIAKRFELPVERLGPMFDKLREWGLMV